MAQSSIQTYPSNCEPCKRRKCRCDRVRPCANCQLRGIADQCYIETPRIEEGRRSSRKRPSETHVQGGTDQSRPLHFRMNGSAASSTSTTGTPASVKSADSSRGDKIHLLSLKAANAAVRWDDVGPFLTSADLCFRLLNFFFDEVRTIHRMKRLV